MNGNLEACKRYCLREKSFNCKSFDFVYEEFRCNLSNATQRTPEAYFSFPSKGLYYELQEKVEVTYKNEKKMEYPSDDVEIVP